MRHDRDVPDAFAGDGHPGLVRLGRIPGSLDALDRGLAVPSGSTPRPTKDSRSTARPLREGAPEDAVARLAGRQQLDGSGLSKLERLTWASPAIGGVAGWRGRSTARVVAAVVASVAALVVVALNEHAPLDVQAGPTARLIAALVPLLAAGLVGATVMRPGPGYLAILLTIPIVDVGQVSWSDGPVQVIAQTICVLAIGLGLALRDPQTSGATAGAMGATGGATAGSMGATGGATEAAMGADTARTRLPRLVELTPSSVAAAAALAMLALACLSTALSPNVELSATVLLHGILEPAAMAAALIALRPDRRFLAVTLVVLASSVAIGGLLNMVQTLATVHSLSVLQAQRLLFSRITYFNVGLFGEMLAMATPLLLTALLARRHLHLGRRIVAVLAMATLVSLISLFLTFSKSAYLATAGGSLVLIILVARTWRRRASIVLIAGLFSTAVIPWPAFFLQPVPPLEQAYRTVVVSLIGESRYDSWNPSTLSGTGSLVERFYATRAAVEMAVDHPVLGIGLDQFLLQYANHYRPPQAKLDLDSAHSMWPEVAAELGIPVLLLVVLIYAAALLALWRLYRDPPDDFTRLLAAGLLASLTSWLLVATAFAGDMYRPWRNMASDYVMMMVLVAAAFALYQVARRRDGTV